MAGLHHHVTGLGVCDYGAIIHELHRAKVPNGDTGSIQGVLHQSSAVLNQADLGIGGGNHRGVDPAPAGAATGSAGAGVTVTWAFAGAVAATFAAAAAAGTFAIGALTATGFGVSTTGAGVVTTTGRSKAIWTVASALRGACTWLASSRVEVGSASRWAGASAAWAAMPLVKTRPDAAAMTAAWRPTPPALSATDLDRTARALVWTGTARRRP
ncbi:hypothetical protein ARZXY2_4335 (plasmid) [Arthrobacter sp. ZXY-2]|nr:hypothetical protein ARZXY2_4335 [Arthrobacter sp. ZXY-2]